MIATFLLSAALSAAVPPASAPAGESGLQRLAVEADVIAADNVTRALAASGHVQATYGVLSLRSESVSRDAEGTVRFSDPTCVTTCTNAVGHTHWNVSGEVTFREQDHVLLRNAWVRFCEIPVLWVPYLYYPLGTDNGFSWMPGYTGRWGAYLLTKYTYHLVGDVHHRENTWWLQGDTRFDLRWEQGLALGEDLEWNLGNFGKGDFQFYHAWDQRADDNYGLQNFARPLHAMSWGSGVDERRYGVSARHAWEASERDMVWVRANVYSDAYFRYDFYRRAMFNFKSQWIGQDNSGVFWEHLEDRLSFGAETSGRLNRFYGMTGRLPEAYVDVNPLPVFGLPVNYESENRFGYLTRDPAEYGTGMLTDYCYNPGPWADYRAFRLDSYHRLTAPVKMCGDVMSVVPRLAYRGTYWSEHGATDLAGRLQPDARGALVRSVFEAGSTFSARGTGWVDDEWSHMTEPYLDVLAQEAVYSGLGDRGRPYVFDSLDASSSWEDQFAGRSRNLPYSYYGLTPGWRNAWDRMDERGRLNKVLDLDVYTALQIGEASYYGTSDAHKLAEAGKPNYGEHGYMLVPGARLKWMPASDVTLGTRVEYDSDHDRVAYANAGFQHKVSADFKYSANYALRDFRYWDYSTTTYDAGQMMTDELDFSRVHTLAFGWEHQLCDWLAWGPQVRWDLRANELDMAGAWIDFLTDCLGFRLLLEYDNKYQTFDGYIHDEDWSIGFYVYLRCFGADSGNLFMN